MSAKPWQDYNYDVFADDIQKIMNTLKLEQKFAIIGFSMGGGIVMRYVAKYYPKTLSHVVFMGGSLRLLLPNEMAILMDRLNHFVTRLSQD